MDEYVAFEAAGDGVEIAPASYYVPADLTPVVDLLAAHGVGGVPLEDDTAISAEQFVISGTSLSERSFEGHNERTVEGDWELVQRTVPAGTLVVPVTPRLGRLVLALLEPRSDDGVVNWNLLDERIAADPVYPILRLPAEQLPRSERETRRPTRGASTSGSGVVLERLPEPRARR